MASTTDTSWERWLQRLTDTIAYATLAASSVLAVLANRQGGEVLLVTLGIAGLSALWVYLLYTMAPAPRTAHRVRMAVFFAGLLAFASVLMLRDPRFFVFAISGFFYASALRPLPLAILGVFATSFLINTLLPPDNNNRTMDYVATIFIE